MIKWDQITSCTTDDGVIIPFERSRVRINTEAKPQSEVILVCNADEMLTESVKDLLGGALTFTALRTRMLRHRMQQKKDKKENPEDAIRPSRLEVGWERARVVQHIKYCPTCLLRHGGNDVSTKQLIVPASLAVH